MHELGQTFCPFCVSFWFAQTTTSINRNTEKNGGRCWGLWSKHRISFCFSEGLAHASAMLPRKGRERWAEPAPWGLSHVPTTLLPVRAVQNPQWASEGILGKNPTKAPSVQWLLEGSGARTPGFSFPLGDIVVCDLRQATEVFWASISSCVTGTITVPTS